jgi:hypothetical protein
MSLAFTILFNNWSSSLKDLLSFASTNKDLSILSNKQECELVWYRLASTLTSIFPGFALKQRVRTWKYTAIELNKYFTFLEGMIDSDLYLKPFLQLCRVGHWQVITEHLTIMSLQQVEPHFEQVEPPFGLNIFHMGELDWTHNLYDLLPILLVADEENDLEYNSLEAINIVVNKIGLPNMRDLTDATSIMLDCLVELFNNDDLLEKIDKFHRRLMSILEERLLKEYLCYTPDFSE